MFYRVENHLKPVSTRKQTHARASGKMCCTARWKSTRSCSQACWEMQPRRGPWHRLSGQECSIGQHWPLIRAMHCQHTESAHARPSESGTYPHFVGRNDGIGIITQVIDQRSCNCHTLLYLTMR